ncbi:hypothetical protein Dda3937_02925 [Dickeya dadantii 3937]|uniref:Uncharacterized protein n=1 Tax=Dickeya dadantii (strain 3937) TaxID=198628 RepID=E0SCR1_DICD3|nr:hypothetical protein Dda3937_02925 [Dickeya dadantii 3937]
MAIFTGTTSLDQVWHDVANNIKVLSSPVSMITAVAFIRQRLPRVFSADSRISIPHRLFRFLNSVEFYFHFF